MLIFNSLLFAAIATLFASSLDTSTDNITNISGTWIGRSHGLTHLLMLHDGYLTLTSYDREKKKFYYTRGGGYAINSGRIMLRCQFNSADKTLVGKDLPIAYTRNGKNLEIHDGNELLSLQLFDSSVTSLNGCWRINGRVQDGKMSEMPLRDRKTLKILTGTHFQWVAINTVTGEFFGTGGGTYHFNNGSYQEHIEFFSRDSTRIGMSLTFKDEVKDGVWHHSGTSSKGDPIQETWIRYKP